MSTTRTIHAPAAVMFELLATPAGHVQVDDSGMLLSTPDAAPVEKPGDTFSVHMDRRPLGDIPDLVEYDVVVVITRLEPNVLIEWSVMNRQTGQPHGHLYGYQFDEVSPTETVVTSYYDWSSIAEERKGPRWPVVPLSMLEASIANLERIVTA